MHAQKFKILDKTHGAKLAIQFRILIIFSLALILNIYIDNFFFFLETDTLIIYYYYYYLQVKRIWINLKPNGSDPSVTYLG